MKNSKLLFHIIKNLFFGHPGESDQYNIWVQLLRRAGVIIEEPSPDTATTALGLTAQLTPRIVLHPSCCVFPCELRKIFPSPRDICISQVSSLVMKGEITLESLVLDGSLRLTANMGSSLHCNFYLSEPITNFGKALTNLMCFLQWRPPHDHLFAGSSIQVIDEDELSRHPETVRMRGYKIIPYEEASVQTECGKVGPVLFTSDDWSRLRYESSVAVFCL